MFAENTFISLCSFDNDGYVWVICNVSCSVRCRNRLRLRHWSIGCTARMRVAVPRSNEHRNQLFIGATPRSILLIHLPSADIFVDLSRSETRSPQFPKALALNQHRQTGTAFPTGFHSGQGESAGSLKAQIFVRPLQPDFGGCGKLLFLKGTKIRPALAAEGCISIPLGTFSAASKAAP